VTLEGAVLPAISANDQERRIEGGCLVQLPDLGDIHEMVVWGTRAKGATKPREFTVTLSRRKLGSDEPPQALISIDLKEVGEGAFEKSAELSEREIPLLDEDEGETGRTTVSRRKIINNERWVYFVEAEFLAGGDTPAESYDINLIQISCND